MLFFKSLAIAARITLFTVFAGGTILETSTQGSNDPVLVTATISEFIALHHHSTLTLDVDAPTPKALDRNSVNSGSHA